MGFNVGGDPHSSFSVSQDTTVVTEEQKEGRIIVHLILLAFYSLIGYGLYSAYIYLFGS